METKKYVLTADCFVGKKGDIITLKDGMDGDYWFNKTQNTMGCPFCEYELIEEVV